MNANEILVVVFSPIISRFEFNTWYFILWIRNLLLFSEIPQKQRCRPIHTLIVLTRLVWWIWRFVFVISPVVLNYIRTELRNVMRNNREKKEGKKSATIIVSCSSFTLSKRIKIAIVIRTIGNSSHLTSSLSCLKCAFFSSLSDSRFLS